MVIQIEELKSFLAQAADSNGKGPSSVKHDRTDKIHKFMLQELMLQNLVARMLDRRPERETIPRYLYQAVVCGTDPTRGRA